MNVIIVHLRLYITRSVSGLYAKTDHFQSHLVLCIYDGSGPDPFPPPRNKRERFGYARLVRGGVSQG